MKAFSCLLYQRMELPNKIITKNVCERAHYAIVLYDIQYSFFSMLNTLPIYPFWNMQAALNILDYSTKQKP